MECVATVESRGAESVEMIDKRRPKRTGLAEARPAARTDFVALTIPLRPVRGATGQAEPQLATRTTLNIGINA